MSQTRIVKKRWTVRSVLRVMLMIPVLITWTLMTCFKLHTIRLLWEHHRPQEHHREIANQTVKEQTEVTQSPFRRFADQKTFYREYVPKQKRGDNQCHAQQQPACKCSRGV